jgi:hypothetical protein
MGTPSSAKELDKGMVPFGHGAGRASAHHRDCHGTGIGGESRRCSRSFAEEKFYEPRRHKGFCAGEKEKQSATQEGLGGPASTP